MPDIPQQTQPFGNMTPNTQFVPKREPSPVPKGVGSSKIALAQLAMQGLIGAK